MRFASRRDFLKTSTAAVAACWGLGLTRTALAAEAAESEPLFKISLAEWSLHNALFAGKINNMQFPEIAKKEFGIDGVEYVNAFFKDKAKDQAYLTELKQRCDDLEVRSLLIMCDGEGELGNADEAARKQAVENHYRWIEAAKFLGCHSIRVNAQSSGSYDEQRDRAADGLGKLGVFADQHGLNVIVENHGGLSSNGEWLSAVMKQVGMPNVGTLPDFGNFYEYDRYQGVTDLMPFAKAVSAKSYQFDAEGNETKVDYFRMMQIVKDSGYRGYVGIEWEGGEPDEYGGIRLTKKLLERAFAKVSA